MTDLPVNRANAVGTAAMSHPDPHGAPDLTPLQIGEIWENPATREHGTLLELPHQNPNGSLVAQLIARVGAKVVGEHRHPIIVERFTTLEGELTVKRNGKTGILREGESTTIEPNEWHDWWNASGRDVRVRVEVTPGERFLHMIETFWGLARLGHTDANGMPNLLQLALCAREFSDVMTLRSPPLLMQRAMFGVLAPLAYSRGYRATYPQFSRAVLAPRK